MKIGSGHDISSLQKKIKNKIMNKWAELRNPLDTVQEVFNLTKSIKTQIQVAGSFNLELSNDFPSININEISTEETPGDEFEINKVSRGKMLYSRIGSVKYTPLSCNGSIGDKELEYQRSLYNVFI